MKYLIILIIGIACTKAAPQNEGGFKSGVKGRNHNQGVQNITNYHGPDIFPTDEKNPTDFHGPDSFPDNMRNFTAYHGIDNFPNMLNLTGSSLTVHNNSKPKDYEKGVCYVEVP